MSFHFRWPPNFGKHSEGSGSLSPSINVTLADINNQPLANLSGLDWMWWDSLPLPGMTTPPGAPDDYGSGATTDNFGLFSLLAPATGLHSGQYGFILITNSTGNGNEDPIGKVASGPVQIR